MPRQFLESPSHHLPTTASFDSRTQKETVGASTSAGPQDRPLCPGLERTIVGMSEALHLGQAQPRLGELLRRATQDRERITITDPDRPSGPSAVLMSAEDLTDLEDALAFARFEARAAAGTQVLVPHGEAKARLGFA